ncbi:High affinity cGMP-specific 3',5'-cyclic phosphodiesterase 9A [Frankliniella fusca]|uniref:High affinity cGMP-specific 3',5'-cyclic phosphodiesterase 9A n=1 Tax=Frankliniella fusca TaxID=407009 RepID=A0AAE1GT02_9NEOP|nr:High affinity cGMP-specific 3',5'-cyclic phosphodiesterase 9A [Frankliniella fusca]
MVLIKVADISNEARPMHVAEPWLDRLLTEFFRQSDAEKLEGLPVTPFMDRDKITKPSSQVSFIGFVLLPLFEALGALLPELEDMIVKPVREALEYYRRLNEQCREERIHRKSIADIGDLPSAHAVHVASHAAQDSQAMVKSVSGHSVKSRKSFQQVRSRSRSAEEETLERPAEGAGNDDAVMENLREQDEEGEAEDGAEDAEEDDDANEDGADEAEEDETEEETATEVEVSEKTLKFKISTESGRKSYPGSRKGSRDKSQLSGDLAHQELARAVRDLHHHQHHHHYHPPAPARSSMATSPQSGRSVEFSRCNGDKETKCLSFEDDTLSRSSHSPCSGSDSKRGSMAGAGAGAGRTRSPQPAALPVDSPSTPPPAAPAGGAAPAAGGTSPKLRSPSSFLKKLKNLTERLSFSVSSDSGREHGSPHGSPSHANCQPSPSPSPSPLAPSPVPSPVPGAGAATCPASPLLHQSDQAASLPAGHSVGDSRDLRATLPKTRGPRGWRSLLGADAGVPERRRQASVTCPSEAPAAGAPAAPSPSPAGAEVDSAEPAELSGNNNNRRKGGNLWSPGGGPGPGPGSRRGGGLLTRLKQTGDSIHNTGAAAAAGSEAATGAGAGAGAGGGAEGGSAAGRQTGIMASLAASFRPKKPSAAGPTGPSAP